MSVTNLTRWSIATLVFVGLAYLDIKTGNHLGVLLLMLSILILISVFGGHGRPSASHDEGGLRSEVRLDGEGGLQDEDGLPDKHGQNELSDEDRHSNKDPDGL